MLFLKYEIRSAVRGLVQLCVTFHIIIIMTTKHMYSESVLNEKCKKWISTSLLWTVKWASDAEMMLINSHRAQQGVGAPQSLTGPPGHLGATVFLGDERGTGWKDPGLHFFVLSCVNLYEAVNGKHVVTSDGLVWLLDKIRSVFSFLFSFFFHTQ